MSLLTLINDIQTLANNRRSLESQLRTNRTDLISKRQELRTEILALNETGGAGLPAGFLADGSTIVKRNNLIIEVIYNQSENVVVDVKIINDEEADAYFDLTP